MDLQNRYPRILSNKKNKNMFFTSRGFPQDFMIKITQTKTQKTR